MLKTTATRAVSSAISLWSSTFETLVSFGWAPATCFAERAVVSYVSSSRLSSSHLWQSTHEVLQCCTGSLNTWRLDNLSSQLLRVTDTCLVDNHGTKLLHEASPFAR